MKKNDDLQESHTDEEEDLFDLSLDDLEPEDTIIEPHVDESDDEIIELIDLVEKGDIDLIDDDRKPDLLIESIQEFADDENDGLKTDKTLDLLSIPLDQSLEPDRLDELKEAGEGIDVFELADVEVDLLNEKDQGHPADTIQTTEVFFDDIAEETTLNELLGDEIKTIKADSEIEGGLFEAGIKDMEGTQVTQKEDKTMRIYPAGPESPELFQEIKPEEPKQPAISPLEEAKVEEKPAVEPSYFAPEKEETPQTPPSEAMLTGVSEEKIEAVVKKAVQDTVERVAKEAMIEVVEKATRNIITEIVEKTARDTMAEVVEKVARETIVDTVEKITRETMADLMEKIAGETAGIMERVARETSAGVAERVITDAINILKNSIESATD